MMWNYQLSVVIYLFFYRFRLFPFFFAGKSKETENNKKSRCTKSTTKQRVKNADAETLYEERKLI